MGAPIVAWTWGRDHYELAHAGPSGFGVLVRIGRGASIQTAMIPLSDRDVSEWLSWDDEARMTAAEAWFRGDLNLPA